MLYRNTCLLLEVKIAFDPAYVGRLVCSVIISLKGRKVLRLCYYRSTVIYSYSPYTNSKISEMPFLGKRFGNGNRITDWG